MSSIKLRPLSRKPVLTDYTEIFGIFVVHYKKTEQGWRVSFQLRNMADIEPEKHWTYADPIWWPPQVDDDGYGYANMTAAREDVRRKFFKWRDAMREQKRQQASHDPSDVLAS